MAMKYETVKVADLSNDPANARKHGEKNIATIVASLRRFGQQKPIVVDSSGVVRAGNGTLEAARQLGWDTIEIQRTELTSSDAIAYAIADNRTSELAEWDDDILAAQLQGLLTEDEELLDAAGFDEDELAALLDELTGDGTTGSADDNYSRKIETPVYEITGDKPSVAELFDRTKADQLLAKIEAAKLPSEIGDFLRYAAERHVVFNFRNIAEFYAHSDADVQELFEQSALVIIDFNRAIEDGFVKLTEAVADQYAKDYPDAE
jgi:ParB-like chromosome segregation protein Spo0J